MHNKSVKQFRELLIATATIFLLQSSLQLHSSEIIKLKVATSSKDQVNLVVGNSQVIELDKKILTAQVTDKDLVDIFALNPKRIQLIARTPGVTTLNLWDENNQHQTLKLSVNVDTKPIEKLLHTLIPESQIRIRTIPGGIALTGNVNRTEEIDLCNQLVRNYYATEHLSIVNGIKVPSTQPVRLNISILTISQDPNLSAEGSIQSRLIPPGGHLSFSNSDQSFTFGILNQEDAVFNYLDRLSKSGRMTILSKPSLLSESGRSARFTLRNTITTPPFSGQSSPTSLPLNLSLNLTATLQSQTSILVQVQPEITATIQNNPLSPDSVKGNAVKQTATTAIELQSGQTLAIAVTLTGKGVPTQDELPTTRHPQAHQAHQATGIRTFSKQELELLLLITPHIASTQDLSRTSGKPNRLESGPSTLKSEQRQLSRTRKTNTISDKTIGRSQLLNGIIVPDVERNNSQQAL